MNIFIVTNKHFLESHTVIEAIFYGSSLANTAERLRKNNYILVPIMKIITTL